MAVRYTKQLVTKVRAAVDTRVRGLHQAYGISQAEVVRLAIDAGLPQVERQLARQAAAERLTSEATEETAAA